MERQKQHIPLRFPSSGVATAAAVRGSDYYVKVAVAQLRVFISVFRPTSVLPASAGQLPVPGVYVLIHKFAAVHVAAA